MLARVRCGKISLGAHAASSGDDESSPTSPDECSAPSDDGFNDELRSQRFHARTLGRHARPRRRFGIGALAQRRRIGAPSTHGVHARQFRRLPPHDHGAVINITTINARRHRPRTRAAKPRPNFPKTCAPTPPIPTSSSPIAPSRARSTSARAAPPRAPRPSSSSPTGTSPARRRPDTPTASSSLVSSSSPPLAPRDSHPFSASARISFAVLSNRASVPSRRSASTKSSTNPSLALPSRRVRSSRSSSSSTPDPTTRPRRRRALASSRASSCPFAFAFASRSSSRLRVARKLSPRVARARHVAVARVVARVARRASSSADFRAIDRSIDRSVDRSMRLNPKPYPIDVTGFRIRTAPSSGLRARVARAAQKDARGVAAATRRATRGRDARRARRARRSSARARREGRRW